MVLAQGGEVKAIDLESAVPARSALKTYSPEAMPPEFAVASRGGVSLRDDKTLQRHNYTNVFRVISSRVI